MAGRQQKWSLIVLTTGMQSLMEEINHPPLPLSTIFLFVGFGFYLSIDFFVIAQI